MERNENPYKWDGHRPRHHVPRKLINTVIDRIQRGKSGYLVGCRGMGKSVFLYELEKALRQPDIELLLFPNPASSRTDAIQKVADEMGKASLARGASEDFVERLRSYSKRGQLDELFDAYLDATPKEIERLVLLYDDLDGYADASHFGRYFFNQLEQIRKKFEGHLVVFAAGGLGLVAIDTLMSSSFFSRMKGEVLEPFGPDDLKLLAQPFEERGASLSEEILDSLRLATGGNVALATFGMERLWEIENPSERDVTEAFEYFRDNHGMVFLHKIRGPIFDALLSDTPEQVWRELQRSGGEMPQLRLRELVARGKRRLPVDEARWIFTMLRSTGLIRASDKTYRQSTIQVEIIPSILTMDVPEQPHVKTTLRDQLAADLCDVLASIHRMALDFYRSGDEGEKQLVPESVFSAALVLGLEPRGWKVEREPQSAAGRTDIKARHDRFGERWVVVELKIWGRNHATIQSQVTSYWAKDVAVLATVMITDQFQNAEWCGQYIQTCLDGQGLSHEPKEHPPWLAGYFIGRTLNCPVEEVDHFLLRLPKRR